MVYEQKIGDASTCTQCGHPIVFTGKYWDHSEEDFRPRHIAIPHGPASHATANGGDCYLQDTRQVVGNSMLWWVKDGKGYACDIRKAHVFSEAEAKEISSRSPHFVAWPKAYIDARVSHHIDQQLVSRDQA